MSLPLAGRTVALAEGRQLEDLAALLEQEGATTLRCPMFRILDAPDPAPVLAWIDDLIAGRFDLVVLMTGEAVRRLCDLAERHGRRDAFVQALAATSTLTRGPKPAVALRELGLKPTRTAQAPTTAGVITTLQKEPPAGKTVGVTLYGSDNPALTGYLESVGATPRPVLSYVYAPGSDEERVAALIAALDGGTVDAIIFTSSAQVDRLFEVAGQRGQEEALRRGLARARVAAVGPVMADRLHEAAVRVDLCPEQGWVMKNLVQKLVRDLAPPA